MEFYKSKQVEGIITNLKQNNEKTIYNNTKFNMDFCIYSS